LDALKCVDAAISWADLRFTSEPRPGTDDVPAAGKSCLGSLRAVAYVGSGSEPYVLTV
jgi:hypothetical protein